MSSLSHSTAALTDAFRDSEFLSAATQRPTWIDEHRPTFHDPHGACLDVAIVDDRPLMRDCLGRSLAIIEPNLALSYHSSLEELAESGGEKAAGPRVVLLCLVWSKSRTDTLMSQVAALRAANDVSAVVVLSDIEDLNDVSRLIEGGISGYIPNTVNLEVAVKAIQLVAAGGVFIPASILFWSNNLIREISQRKKQPESAFTSRQAAVIESLRRGKANKIIAYELNMCESTVKVHIRNIMKKLKAKNRTEVAYILNSMLGRDSVEISN